MTRTLYIGDPHVVPGELAECERLMELAEQVAHDRAVEELCVLGDLHHNHALVHVDVSAFWSRWLERLGWISRRKVLKGNHDGSEAGAGLHHALESYRHLATVVDEPVYEEGRLYLPYYHSTDEFLAAAASHPEAGCLVCHQTFDGSRMGEGFYAEGAARPDAVPQPEVISGHIHAPQRVGKVWYVGAPRWRIITDANEQRSIWVVDHKTDGSIFAAEPFATDKACTPIVRLDDQQDRPASLVAGARCMVDVRGPAAYVERRCRELERLGARARGFADQLHEDRRISECEGIAPAFIRFLTTYRPRGGTSSERLVVMARERMAHVGGME